MAISLAVPVAASGCAAGSAPDGSTVGAGDSVAPSATVIGVPSGFGAELTAASDDLVVGVVGDPYRTDARSTVVAVALDTGRVTTFPGPADGEVPVAMSGLVAKDDGFVGVGDHCEPPGGGEGCGGARVLVELDPEALTWRVSALPLDSVGPLDGLFVVGDDLVVVESDGARTRVSRRSADGRWTTVAEPTTTERAAPCVSGHDLWRFTRTSAGAADGNARYALTRTDLASGASESVDLPDLASYFGGVTTTFGCDQNGPLLASSPPGPVPDADAREKADALTGVAVWSFTGSSWTPVEVTAMQGATVANQIVSGDRALLLAGDLEATGADRLLAVVLGPDGGIEVPSNGTDSYLWPGDTGDLVRIFDRPDGRQLTVVPTGS